MKQSINSILGAIILFALAFFSAIFPISCSSAGNLGLVIVRPLENAPKLCDIRTKSATEIVCEFSAQVNVVKLFAVRVSENGEEIGDEAECFGSCDQNGVLTIELAERTEIGQKYKMSGTVENSAKSTLSFSFFFLGMNDHRCNLVLSEIRDGYSSKKQECEFIEVYAVTSGNTAGIEIFSATDGEEKTYRFPAIEVNAGDFITVHLRSLSENCVDELGNTLNLNQKISDTNSKSRDLFKEGNTAHLGGDADVILLRDCETKEVLDALCYAKKSKIENNDWKKKECAVAAEKATAAGVWDGKGIDRAFNADGFTQTHSLARQNIPALKNASFPYPNGAQCWIVTANKNEITPGKPNSSSAKK